MNRLLLILPCLLALGCDITIENDLGSIDLDALLSARVPVEPQFCFDCEVPEEFRGIPPVDLPPSLCERNYAGGSCMWASTINVLRWQGKHEEAAYWRANYRGAANVQDMASAAQRRGLDYAYTATGDADFLEWASATGRGASMHYKPVHACAFFGFVERDGTQYAVVNDNNRPDRLEYVEKQRFIREWKSYGGLAFTVVYSPAPPRPWLCQR